MRELKANPNKRAVGTVIDAALDKGRGIVTTILVQAGKLKVGDPAAEAALWRAPDDIGDYVVQAIKRGDLFIMTHSEFKPGWEAHAAAITRSFPDVPYNQDFMKIFSHITHNPIYDK